MIHGPFCNTSYLTKKKGGKTDTKNVFVQVALKSRKIPISRLLKLCHYFFNPILSTRKTRSRYEPVTIFQASQAQQSGNAGVAAGQPPQLQQMLSQQQSLGQHPIRMQMQAPMLNQAGNQGGPPPNTVPGQSPTQQQWYKHQQLLQLQQQQQQRAQQQQQQQPFTAPPSYQQQRLPAIRQQHMGYNR